MMRRAASLVLFLVAVLYAVPACADWTVEFLLGGAINAPTEMTIEQANEPPLDFDAEFVTEPFKQPIYWDFRLAWEGERHGWALDLQHHKLILENPPPEVENFSITHGYNLLNVQHIWLRPQWRFFVLLGIVVAHPESTVRGLEYDESGGWFNAGYHANGPVMGGGVGHSVRISSFLDLALEARVTWSTVGVDVADGLATLDNLALHLLVGPRSRIH
jgi:hypothetical protein